MKKFYERYRLSDSKLQRCVAVLPWRHNLLILEKVNDDKEAMFYINKSAENG
jgi:predicted nuclease of restriction endonuclease-like (RecB) superfamily